LNGSYRLVSILIKVFLRQMLARVPNFQGPFRLIMLVYGADADPRLT
jgi:hypothetical protein